MDDQQTIVKEARPGKGAAGNQWAVQTAQQTHVNAPDARIPSNAPVDVNQHQIEEMAEQEVGHELKTTDGYVIDESGRLDNFPVEPPVYLQQKRRFGFTPTAEIINGRAAMIGFLALILIELSTGQGLLSFLGLL